MSNNIFQIYKEVALPAILAPNAIYIIAPPTDAIHVEIYVTNAAGTASRKVLDAADVQTMINQTIAGANELFVVADIAARNALLPLTVAKFVYVIDATADATVSLGGATYIYNPADTSWTKISEAESMDAVINWGNIVGRPTSSPAQIDAAVAATHTHANKTQIDKITEDAGGNLLYSGGLPATGWTSTNW